MPAPLVSVVMNCRNGARFVRPAIQSVLDQSVDDFELVFWDNRSTDATAEIVRGFSDRRIRYVLSDRNDPLGAARNRAFASARGRLVAILDADDIWLPHLLEEQITGLERSGAALIYANATSFYPDGREHPYSRRTGQVIRNVDYRELASDYDICISTVLFARQVLEGLTYVFDPELTVAEEADLFIRIAHRAGAAYNPSRLARYRMHATSDTWRHAERFVVDAVRIADNFATLGIDPEIIKDGILQSAHWTAAMASWMKADGPTARDHLRAMRHRRGLRVVTLFVLSHLPYRAVAPLLRKLGKRAL